MLPNLFLFSRLRINFTKMLNFIILGGIFTGVYLTALALVISRYKSPYILRRSPTMLSLSLIGNLFQTIILLSQFDKISDYYVNSHNQNCSFFLRLQQSGNLIFHYIMFFPYVLRAYRIYLIFKLDKHWNDYEFSFIKYSHRISQNWMLKIFLVGLIPFLAMVIIVIYSCEIASYMPASETKTHPNYSQSLYIWISCLEQLFFIYSIYMLREVTDDYKMTQELTVAMLFWFISPMFSVFPPADLGRYSAVPGILKNLCLFLVSIIYPLVWSFRSSQAQESLTLEMLNSLDLILQNKAPLEYFESFMRSLESRTNESNMEYSGYDLLHIFMKCETFLMYPETVDKEELIDELIKTDIVTFNYLADSKETLDDNVLMAKKALFVFLEENYFPKFKKSRQYAILKRIVHRQEIYTGRLVQIGLSNFNYFDKDTCNC